MNAISYLPGAEEQIIAQKIVQLAQGIKKDIGKYLGYQEHLGESEQVQRLAQGCKGRVLEKLSQIANMQEVEKKDTTQWKAILKIALSRVYKHRHTDEFEKKLSQLFMEYELDTSSSKVHFVRAYMEIVARIPQEQISIPFHQ